MALSKAASSSSSSSTSFRCAYDVFLSFRGADTRTTFTDHLHTALIQAGIRTFRDDNEIERGEKIKLQLDKAIEKSYVSIIVFSPNYAHSSWCLDELEMINDRRKAGLGYILPIFYHVDPNHVRWQKESFAKAFAEHEKRQELDRMDKWRVALREVADLSGEVLNKDQHEAPFIQNVIQIVQKKLNRQCLSVSPHLVGIDYYADRINLWLQDDQSNDVKILSIYGIGGVGKTTIAKIVYNQNYEKFEGSCFLSEVRDKSGKNGVPSLHEELLSKILRGKQVEKIYSVDEGVIRVQETICCRKVLIVLDDVVDFEQFKQIIGEQEWLFPGSKIILTTRVKSSLNVREGFWTLEIRPLGHHDSFKLFNLHAFGQDDPPENLIEHSKRVVSYCDGLPLALRILGASLFGKNIGSWDSAIQEMQAIPNGDIQKILKISYDSLQNDRHQEIFLHIACFFIGEEKDVVVKILDGCGFYAINGIEHLIDRCLIAINEYNELVMHQLVRKMGREIIRKESPDEPGKRSRVWDYADAYTVLTEKTGTETVKGLAFDLHMLKEDQSMKTVLSSRNCFSDNSVEKSRLAHQHNVSSISHIFSQAKNYVQAILSPSSDLIQTEAFVKMTKLNLLKLNNVTLTGWYGDFPKNLVWLCWHGFSLKFIPTNICLEKLVVLDMRNSSLHVWHGKLYFPCLKILDLSHSHFLAMISDFNGVPSLERLILKDCIDLVKIDESIAVLDGLILLNLEGCVKLEKLPTGVCSLETLGTLILTDCSGLKELPRELVQMKSLQVFIADGVALNELFLTSTDARNVGWLTTIQSMFLSRRECPESISSLSAVLPGSLVRLSLSRSKISDDRILKDFSSFCFLEELDLSHNPITTLPESIASIPQPIALNLDECSCLLAIQKLPNVVSRLSMVGCKSVIHLPDLSRTNVFLLMSCENLVEIEDTFKLQPIEDTDVERISALRMYNIESLEALASLEMEMVNFLAAWRRRTSVQVLYELGGILTVFLPGSEIPSWYTYQAEGSSLSFQFKCYAGNKMIGLNIGTIYELEGDHVEGPSVRIENTTKSLRWIYTPVFLAIPANPESLCKDMLWLSHLRFSDFEFEDGDRVKVEVVMESMFHIKKVGIHIIYEEEESQSIINSACWQSLSQVLPPTFQPQSEQRLGKFLGSARILRRT